MPFPVDLLVEILLRLPAKSLLRFKIVCKSWYNLINSSDFVDLHLKRSLATKTNRHLIFKSSTLYLSDFNKFDNSNPLNYPFKSLDQGGVSVVGSCNGLLCLEISDLPLLIYNPTTQTYKSLPWLPNMPISAPYTLQLSNVAFGYESITRDYRCVRINRNTSTMTNSIESDVMVYSLKDDSWRKAATPNVPYNLRFLGCYNTDSVFLNGAIHWDGFINEPLRSVSIVTFNLREECFSTLPVPNLVSIGIGRMFVGVLDGSLCLVVNESWGDTHLWVMKEYGIPESWIKLFSFAKLNTSIYEGVAYPICYSMSLKELFVQTTKWKVASIDLDTMEIEHVKDANLSQCTDAHVCVENLMMLRG